jgi:hypothetical protein
VSNEMGLIIIEQSLENEKEIFDGQVYRVRAYDEKSVDLLIPDCNRQTVDFFYCFLQN